MTFPPGRAKLATMPLLTGSVIWVNRMGMVLVCCWRGANTSAVLTTITSGCSPTSSIAALCMRSRSAASQRYSIRMFCPFVQPSASRPLSNAFRRRAASSCPSARGIITPIRSGFPNCCARAASGQRRRAAEQRDELAALHSITSSASSRNESGIVSPSAFAVLRFTISS